MKAFPFKRKRFKHSGHDPITREPIIIPVLLLPDKPGVPAKGKARDIYKRFWLGRSKAVEKPNA